MAEHEIYTTVGRILRVRRSSVYRYIKKKTVNDENQTIKYKPKKVDNFNEEVIRRALFKMYENKVLWTVPSIQDKIKDEIQISNSLLWRI